MLVSIAALLLLLATPPAIPAFPVVIQTDKAAYTGKDHITVTLVNRNEEPVWVAPFVRLERSEGDGTFTPVYLLRVVEACAAEPPLEAECVELTPGQRMTLATWDWNTGGDDQCPPRRPGHRAFKGVHRLIADWCPTRERPARAESRIKHVTWE